MHRLTSSRLSRSWPALLAGASMACSGSASVGDDLAGGSCALVEGGVYIDQLEACLASKPDTGYVTSLDAREVELTLESDVALARRPSDPAALRAKLEEAALASAQFALTRLRIDEEVYIQSLAEEFADGNEQLEWKVGEAWKKASAVTAGELGVVRRFRLVRVNAMVMDAARRKLKNGNNWSKKVPLKPLRLFDAIGTDCDVGDDHLPVDNDVYWYVWDPSLASCTVEKADASATVTSIMPKGSTVFPEYDRLFADKQLDAVVFFGAVESTKPSDYSFTLVSQFVGHLKDAGFAEQTTTNGLRRFARTRNGITANVDIVTAKQFENLDDTANEQVFFDALNSHELVVFNGHSLLGTSAIWNDPRAYADKSRYQAVLYNGCLGYSYYVEPILRNKGGAANVDIVMNTLETPFWVSPKTSAIVLTNFLLNADKGSGSSWQSILQQLNDYAGRDAAMYGVSGARNNKYRPRGR
jgi:hypothetical protein